MTKKDFELLAEAISAILDPSSKATAAAAVAMACKKANPRFSADKFYQACGLN